METFEKDHLVVEGNESSLVDQMIPSLPEAFKPHTPEIENHEEEPPFIESDQYSDSFVPMESDIYSDTLVEEVQEVLGHELRPIHSLSTNENQNRRSWNVPQDTATQQEQLQRAASNENLLEQATAGEGRHGEAFNTNRWDSKPFHSLNAGSHSSRDNGMERIPTNQYQGSARANPSSEEVYTIYPVGRSNTVKTYSNLDPELSVFPPREENARQVDSSKKEKKRDSKVKEGGKKKKSRSKSETASTVVDPKQLRDRMYHTYYRGYLKEFLQEEMDQLVEARVRSVLRNYLNGIDLDYHVNNSKPANATPREKAEKVDSSRRSSRKKKHSARNPAEQPTQTFQEVNNVYKTQVSSEIVNDPVSPKEVVCLLPKMPTKLEHENKDPVSEPISQIVPSTNEQYESEEVPPVDEITPRATSRLNISVEQIQDLLSSKKPIIPKITDTSKLYSDIDMIIEKISDLHDRQKMESSDPIDIEEESPIETIIEPTPVKSPRVLRPRSALNSARKSSRKPMDSADFSGMESTDDDSDYHYERVSVPIKPLNLKSLKGDDASRNQNQEPTAQEVADTSNIVAKQETLEEPQSNESKEPATLIPIPPPLPSSGASSPTSSHSASSKTSKGYSIVEEPLGNPASLRNIGSARSINSQNPLKDTDESSLQDKIRERIENLKHVENVSPREQQTTQCDVESDEEIDLDQRIKDLIHDTGSTLSKEDLRALARVRVPILVKMYEDLAKGLSKKEALLNMTNRAKEEYEKEQGREGICEPDQNSELEPEPESENPFLSDSQMDEIQAFCEENQGNLLGEKEELLQLRKKYQEEKSIYKDKLTEQDSLMHFKTQVCLTLIETQLYHISRSQGLLSNLLKDPRPEVFHDSLGKWADLEREKTNVRARIQQQDKEYSDLLNRRGNDDELSMLSSSQFASPDRSRNGSMSARSIGRLSRSPRHGLRRKGTLLDDDIKGVFEPIDESDPLFLSYERTRVVSTPLLNRSKEM